MAEIKTDINIVENLFKNPLIQYIGDNTLCARSGIMTQIDIDNMSNNIVTAIDEGATLRSSKNGIYHKRSISTLGKDALNKLFEKNIDRNDELNLYESIRTINRSSTEEKIELLKFMNNQLKDRLKDVKIDIVYLDSEEYKLYVDNTGAILHNQGSVFIQINIQIDDYTFIESIGINLTYDNINDLYKRVDNIIEEFQEKLDIIKKIKVIKYNSAKPMILDPSLAGAFVHEIYGHSLEADNISHIYKKLKIDPKLEITDSPVLPSGIVNYQYDDEGALATENVLIKDGKIKSLIHDKESSKHFNVIPTGNGRSESYTNDILPRMTNLIINKGEWNLEEAISDIKDGYYGYGFIGGGHNPLFNNYSVSPQLCCKISNGNIDGVIRNAYMTGNIIDTLKNIVAIGKDQENTAAVCHKKNQTAIVGIISPFLKIKKVSIIC